MAIISKSYLSLLQICRKLAGYSYGQADILRRAMSKKKHDIMAKERQKFLFGSGTDDGCIGAVANGVPEHIANQIFDQMESFASYAFNKSHAAAYALVAYQTAYLKTHHFGDYMAALMTSVISETGKLTGYMEECRNAGVSVCPPDVNTGEWDFAYRDEKLYFGLLAIKGIGRGLIDHVKAERKTNGSFSGFVDFCRRMSAHGLNKRALEGLIQAGALDSLDCNRRQMMLHYEQVMEAVSNSTESGMEGQMSLFGEAELLASDLQIPFAEEYDPIQRLQMERKATGMYISGHPLACLEYLRRLLRYAKLPEVADAPEYQEVSVMCQLQSFRKIRTKKGDDMAFLTLEGTSGTMEAVVFPNLYRIATFRLEQEQVLFIKGKISRKDGKTKLICESIWSYEDMPLLLRQKMLCIRIGDTDKMEQLTVLCQRFPGETRIAFRLPDGRIVSRKPPLCIEITESSYQALCHLFGDANLAMFDRKS